MSHSLVRYVATARILHWTSAALVLTLIPVGLWMVYLEPAEEQAKLRLYNIHESLGVTVWVLALWRLRVRRRTPPPPLPAELPVPMRLAAHATHVLLYALLLTMPVVGFLATNAWGFPLRWFGLVPIPSPLGANEALAPLLSLLHWWGAALIILLIGAHVGGAMFHHFVRRDDLLGRML